MHHFTATIHQILTKLCKCTLQIYGAGFILHKPVLHKY